MTEILNLLAETATQNPDAANPAAMLTMLIPLAAMILIFYFLIIRPEKKRSKKMKEMLNNLEVADEVVTTGGIIGRVLSVKEDTVLIETGSDRTKIRVLKASIAENRTVHDTTEG
ncbi:MAG: preprotein translocase subunit YajC [Ruminococcaceae bacterium]|nr:preprotein translocase subunit YajC [Oscillospiraceae bacterium]